MPGRAEAKGRSVLAILVGQFKSLIVALVVAATVVAFALGENIEAVAVLVVIVLNAAVGFLTEWKAEQALTATGGTWLTWVRRSRTGAAGSS